MRKALARCARRTEWAGGRRGFTLIEILVVLAIISILITMTVMVASRVTQGGKVEATKRMLEVLDTTLTSYFSDRDEKVPAVYRDDFGTYFPLSDGRAEAAGFDRDAAPADPSLALYLLIAGEVPAVQESLKGIDARFITRGPINFRGDIVRRRLGIGFPPEDVSGITINDAWGRPIRFVHPAWDGGGGEFFPGGAGRALIMLDANGNDVFEPRERLRRSYRPWNPTMPPPGVANPIGDADEGICQGNRPYFYSAGPDGDPGTRSDNVYSTRPTFPPETAKLE